MTPLKGPVSIYVTVPDRCQSDWLDHKEDFPVVLWFMAKVQKSSPDHVGACWEV